MFKYYIVASLLMWYGKDLDDANQRIEKLNPRINTQYDEINPVVSLDGQTMYFTRVGHPSFDKTLKVNEDDISKSLSYQEYRETLQEIYTSLGESKDVNPVSSLFNQDIWIAVTDQEPFDKIDHPKYPLNSALPNSVCAVTTDPEKVIIINQFFKDGSMSKGFSFASKNGDTWHFPEPLFIYDYYNLEADVNLNLSKDNEVMVLSMNRKDSHGKNDLYVSFRVHTTLWSAPVHLGSDINTAGEEITPFISDDKRYLFFSSEREGNQDIMVSERLDEGWTKWSTPRPLPRPINSDAHDSQPFLNAATGYLYFTSTRDGSSDIYRVPYTAPTPKERKLARATKSTPPSTIKCYVVDATSQEPIDAQLAFGPVSSEEFAYDTLVSDRGISLIEGSDQILKFLPQKTGYIGREIRLDLSPEALRGTKVIKIPMDPIVANGQIALDPIFFMRGKDRILSSSYGELDRLSTVLRQHPGLQIRINGHTDNVGDKDALYQLSQKRASAVKQYLVKRGIQSFRIKTRGYGAAAPITDNSTEALRSQNRRVEVVITKV